MTSPRVTSERWIEAEEDDMGLREEELGGGGGTCKVA
jgi:hypothetical protein